MTNWKKCVYEISTGLAGRIADAIAGRSSIVVRPEEVAEQALPQPALGEPAVLPSRETPPVQKSNAVSLGASGLMTDAFDDWGYALNLAYERAFAYSSFYAKIGWIGYQVDNKFYSETARGSGGEIGVRYYPGRHPLDGWYVGVGAGVWSVSGTWKDDLGTPFVTTGNGKTTLGFINIHTGYKIVFGSGNFFLDPSLEIVEYDTDGTPGAFGEILRTVNAGASAGFAW